MKCKRCESEIIDLDSGLCYECEDILEAEHGDIDAWAQCEHGNDKEDCFLCRYEAEDYEKQVNRDYRTAVLGG